MLGEVVPRLLVTEEARNVDEDCIEQLDELVRVPFQVIEILVVGLHAETLHPLLCSASEARALVTGEVESTVRLDVLDQSLELRIGRRSHTSAPSIVRRISAGEISSSGRTRSTAPVLIAAPGIPKKSALA